MTGCVIIAFDLAVPTRDSASILPCTTRSGQPTHRSMDGVP